MTIFNSRLDDAHNSVPAGKINCVKYLIMSHHASLQKSKEIKSPAPVIPIRTAGEKKGKHPGSMSKYKFNQELPLHHNDRIFKAKKHDPL